MASKNKLTVQKQSGSFLIASKTHSALSLKPISLIIFSLFAQHAHADDAFNLQLPQHLTESAIQKHIIVADNAMAEDETESSASPALKLPSNAARYNVTKEMLLAAKVTDENPNGSSAGAKDNVRAASKDQGKNDLPLNLELKEITVRAKRFYQIGPLPGLGLSKEEIPGNVQSITAKEIKESHALSLTDLMNSKLQSVNVNDYQSNPFQMDVTYRGFTASPQIGTAQGLSVFLDGIRVNEPFGDVVNWDMIPLNALNGLDVFPGSNPIFGLGTLGGALSMRTKSGFDANEGTVEALGGSFNRKQFQGSIGGNNGVVAGFVAANIFGEDGWRDNSPSKVNQLFAKGEWRNEKLQFGLSALYAGNKLVGNGLLPTEIAQQDRSQVFTSPDETKNRLMQFQLTGLWDVTDTFNITGQVYKRKSRRNSSTGDVNQNFGGSATQRPQADEKIGYYSPDLNNDGLPDFDLGTVSIANVAVTAEGAQIDANGNAEFSGFVDVPALDEFGNPALDQDGNPIVYTEPNFNVAFDANNLAIGSSANSIAIAGQAVDENGKPLWGINYNAQTSQPTFDAEFYRRALEIFNTPVGSKKASDLNVSLLNYFEAQGQPGIYYDAMSGASSFVDSNGFSASASAIVYDRNLDENGNFKVTNFTGENKGLGKPIGYLYRNPDGTVPQRDGADCVTPIRAQCAGYIEGTPTALITETEIDQVTDGGAIQFNWNLDKHKFMIGMSIDSSNASYQSGQYLGLLDNKRNAYLDPSKVGYEFAAASKKIGLNDFAGNGITKSLYFSETWTPVKEWNFTGAARYNQTRVKNELAINNYLGLLGPTSFKNFYADLAICKDLNGDGAIDVDSDECPSGMMRPFSVELANDLGAIGKGETEKFTYYSFNPSLGATWQPNETLNLYGNWNRGARTPSVIELGCAFDDTPVTEGYEPDGTPIIRPRSLSERRFCSLPSTLSGDPYLKQVRSETTEFGARGYLTADIQWNATVYQTNLTDDIYFISFTPDRSFFQNIGNTRRRGIETGLQGKLGKFGFRLNYSFTDATFQDSFTMASPHNSSAGNVFQYTTGIKPASTGYDQIRVKPGDRMPGVPLHNANATLTYDVTPDWNIGLTAVLHSESFIRGNENNKHRAGAGSSLYDCGKDGSTNSDGGVMYADPSCTVIKNRPNYRFPGKVPGYAVFNFNTSYKVTKGLTAGLQITNLFNREYYSAGRLGINPFSPSINGAIGAGGFNYNSNDWLASSFLAPGAPRSAYFSLRYDFDMGK